MIAPAFMPEPVRRLLHIEEGTVPRVQFSMKPVGSLRGYVAKKEQTYMMAGKERKPDTDVEIHSITLRGHEIHRTLIPLQDDAVSYTELYPEHYLSETDFTAQGTFFFFGLPAGEYEMTINAKGYEQYSEIYNVKLGQYQNTIIIELVKEIIR